MTFPSSPIVYFARLVPDYRVPVLEELNTRIDGRLVVCSGRGGGSDLDVLVGREASTASVVVPDLWIGGGKVHAQAFWHAFRRLPRPAAVIAEDSPRSLTLPVMMAYCKMLRIPVALWGHFSSNRRPVGSSWLDRYRLSLASTADLCITYTERQAEVLRPHIRHRRIVTARNTLDTRTLFDSYDRLAQEGKNSVRVRLGLQPDAATIVYVGRLIAEKRVEVLLDVLIELQKVRNAQLIIIGDGPMRYELEVRARDEGLHHVHFTGALTSMQESAPYIFAADAMLVPGYLGLQVNHAFALGVPVISRACEGQGRFHSPEIDYVEDGSNGILVEGPTAPKFAEAVLACVDDPCLGRNAHQYARQNLRLEVMVDGLEEAVHLLESSVRHSTGIAV